MMEQFLHHESPPAEAAPEAKEREAFKAEALAAVGARVSDVLAELQMQDRCPDCFPLSTEEKAILDRTVYQRLQVSGIANGMEGVILEQIERLVKMRENASAA